MKVKILARLEIADHDGYCSGAECEYTSEYKMYEVSIPRRKYRKTIGMQDFVQFLPKPKIDCWGSGYCDLSKDCQKHNMDKHSHRHTVFCVTSGPPDENDDSNDETDYTDDETEPTAPESDTEESAAT